MNKDLQHSLITIIEQSIEESGFNKESIKNLFLDFPTDTRFGDLSTNIALVLSSIKREPPFQIAEILKKELKKRINDSWLKSYVRDVKIEGKGFINFYLQDKYFYEKLEQLIKGGRDSLGIDIGGGKKIIIEFVSANPTGPLSVAHARQAAVGDTLANILSLLGFKVKREYYLNDEGNQIDILVESVKLRARELNGECVEFPDNYYRGDYIYDIAKQVRENSISNVAEFAVGEILDSIKQDLKDFGIKFDYWYSQKELGSSGKIEEALRLLKRKGLAYEKEGALWFKSTDFGDDKDRVIIKSNGAYTYLAPDIAYHADKYKRGFAWLINLWGPDHHGYINRIKAAIQSLGYPKDSLSVVIVQLASIFKEGKIIEMSTRKGQYITLREVIDEVGSDASRFFFLMRKTSSHLDFDLDIAKKQTPENPVYYVQYAHARICSILRQGHIKKFAKSSDLSLLKEKEELGLIKKILQFSYILNICFKTCDPYRLSVYLQELAQAFHKFYDKHRVLGEQGALTVARLSLIEAARVVIAEGLNLSGVSQPEKM